MAFTLSSAYVGKFRDRRLLVIYTRCMPPLGIFMPIDVLAFLAAAAVPTFLELPTNQTVAEGGDATLGCNATVNGVRQPVGYRIENGAGSTLQSVGGNLSDLSFVDCVVGACVFGEYNTQLILKGVTRQADGYTITCSVLDGVFFVEPQDEPPAFLSVICKSFDLHVMLYHSEGELSLFPSQTHQHTVFSQTNPPLCWKGKTSSIPFCLNLNHLPPTLPGPEMARSSQVVVG